MTGTNAPLPSRGREQRAPRPGNGKTPVTAPSRSSAHHAREAPTPERSDDIDLVTDGGLVCALLDAARAISAEVEARLGDAHMTVAQARLARHFAHSNPGIPMTELAARSGMTAPAVTQILQRMTQKGLVRRSENPLDSRSVIVRLTEMGLREFRAISARLTSIDRELGGRAGTSPQMLARTLARLELTRAR